MRFEIGDVIYNKATDCYYSVIDKANGYIKLSVKDFDRKTYLLCTKEQAFEWSMERWQENGNFILHDRGVKDYV